MPKKSGPENEENVLPILNSNHKNDDEILNLNRMLAAVLSYLSDEEVEVIDIEYLLDHTDGLREWWEQYREQNRKKIEDEIKKSLADLTLEELETIRGQIKKK